MTDAALVSVEGLTKDFGKVRAVEDLTFQVEPGRVTGFLGPNGAGKTTTLRLLVGLERPTAGRCLIGGQPFRQIPAPLRTVGAALDAGGFHPGRTARHHLRIHFLQAGIDPAGVDPLLEQIGLGADADRRVGGYSLGMRQRLGLATALAGEPRVLLLDEPANGLDPQGIAWLRGFLRWLADQGRTVLVSSHLLAEMAQIADDVVIIDRGRLVSAASLVDLLAAAGERGGTVLVRSPQRDDLQVALATEGLSAVAGPAAHDLTVDDARAATVGEIAARAGIPLHLLTEQLPDLEEVFLQLIAETRGTPPGPPVSPP